MGLEEVGEGSEGAEVRMAGLTPGVGSVLSRRPKHALPAPPFTQRRLFGHRGHDAGFRLMCRLRGLAGLLQDQPPA